MDFICNLIDEAIVRLTKSELVVNIDKTQSNAFTRSIITVSLIIITILIAYLIQYIIYEIAKSKSISDFISSTILLIDVVCIYSVLLNMFYRLYNFKCEQCIIHNNYTYIMLEIIIEAILIVLACAWYVFDISFILYKIIKYYIKKYINNTLFDKLFNILESNTFLDTINSLLLYAYNLIILLVCYRLQLILNMFLDSCKLV